MRRASSAQQGNALAASWFPRKEPPRKSRLVLAGDAGTLSRHIIDPSLETLVAVIDPSGAPPGTMAEVQAEGNPPVRVPSLPFDSLAALDFDYLLFLDHKTYSDCGSVLEGLGIKVGKAVLPDFYARHLRGRQFYALEDEIRFFELCREIGAKSLLDVDLLLLQGAIYSCENALLQPLRLRIDGLLPQEADSAGIPPLYRNLYRRLRQDPADLCLQSYTVMLASKDRPREKALQMLEDTYDLSDWIVFYAGKDSLPNGSGFRQELESFGEVSCHPCTKGAFVAVKKRKRTDCRFYVVAHKPCPFPPLPDCCQIIHGGKTDANSIGYPGDNTGDCIPELNPMLNELTAAYWIWKNTRHAYVGLMHYRRYFMGTGEPMAVMDDDEARRLLEDYDIIATDEWLQNASNNSQILYDVGQSGKLNDDARELLLRKIRERQPEYEDAFRRVASGQGIYKCNMIITRKRVFDAYCQWLFSFLLEAARELKPLVEDLPFHQKRVLSFWGERMLTVWLMKQDLRIKEVPMLAFLPREETT